MCGGNLKKNLNLIAIAAFLAMSSQSKALSAEEGGVTLIHIEHIINRVQLPTSRYLQMHSRPVTTQERSAHLNKKEELQRNESNGALSGESRAEAHSSIPGVSRADAEEHYVITSAEKDTAEKSDDHVINKREIEHSVEPGERRDEPQARQSLKYYVGIRHEKRNETQPATNNLLQGNAGVDDGTSVSLGKNPDISELKQSSSVKTLNLKHGDAFVAHNQSVQINTERGQINIAPHAAVYVVAEGNSVAVYNIADSNSKDVSITSSGKKQIAVRAGEQVVLSDKENKEFEKANPLPEIEAKRSRELGEDLQNRIFNAEFSPIAALDHAQGFQKLVNSTNKEDKKLADYILKTAAVVLNLRANSN